jgi:hypothetical protein
MKLRSIKLKGFYGVTFETPIEFSDLGHRNVLIGVNNSGKSILFRFLFFLKSQLANAHTWFGVIEPNVVDDGAWWRHETQQIIEAELTFELPPDLISRLDIIPSLPRERNKEMLQKMATIRHGTDVRIIVRIWNSEDEKRCWSATPMLTIKDEYHLLEGKGQYLNGNGQRTTEKPQDFDDINNKACMILQKWSTQARFFDAVRAIDRPAGRQQMDDGSKLLDELFKWEQEGSRKVTFANFQHHLLTRINSLLVPCGIPKMTSFRFPKNADGKPTMICCFLNQPEIPIDIHSMGSGIAELVMINAAIPR